MPGNMMDSWQSQEQFIEFRDKAETRDRVLVVGLHLKQKTQRLKLHIQILNYCKPVAATYLTEKTSYRVKSVIVKLLEDLRA